MCAAQCDAQRPCTSCSSKGLECEYDTNHGETHNQAVKRKYDDMSRVCDMYEELFEVLASSDERVSADIVRCIRQGQSTRAVLAYARNRHVNFDNPRGPTRRLSQRRAEDFLVSLAHSTVSLRDVVRLAMSAIDLANGNELLSSRIPEALQDRIVHLWHLEAMLQKPPWLHDALSRWRGGGPISTIQQDRFRLIEPPTMTSTAKRAISTRRGSQSQTVGQLVRAESERPQNDVPVHLVPANPWTTITSSDEAVSHLVSLFLTWINPSWRFVEEDLFLKGTCSPFTVTPCVSLQLTVAPARRYALETDEV